MSKILAFIYFISALTTWAGMPSSPCDQCAGKPREKIHLAVTSLDMLFNWQNAGSARTMHERAHEEYCPACKTVSVTAMGGDTLPVLLNEAAKNCQEIALLTTFSHGQSGAVLFGEHPELSAAIFDTFEVESKIPAEMECVMAPSAQIKIFACEVASGVWGNQFLTALGDRLLKKGGQIEACASGQYSFLGSRVICAEPVTHTWALPVQD